MKWQVRILVLVGILHLLTGLCFASSVCHLQLHDGDKALSCRGDAGDILVKRLAAKQEFQGFGFVDDQIVFFTYSDEDSEPSTAVCIFDLGRRQERRIGALGATVDSTFELNRTSGLVTFNWYNGIYVFSAQSAMALPGDANLFSDFEQLLVKIAPCARCVEPRWVNPRTISYFDLERGRKRAQQATVPGRRNGATPAHNYKIP